MNIFFVFILIFVLGNIDAMAPYPYDMPPTPEPEPEWGMRGEEDQMKPMDPYPMPPTPGPEWGMRGEEDRMEIERQGCDTGAQFREADGMCNNLANPNQGRSITAFPRFIPNAYSGDNKPRVAVSGNALPNARLVSATIHTDSDAPDAIATNAFVMFGQFLDHDITETPAESDAGCCDTPDAEGCNPIIFADSPDPFFSELRDPQTCISLSRSADCAGSSTCTAQSPSPNGVREQENGITGFVDATNVYGFDETNTNNLRSGSGGLLLSTELDAGELLPVLSADVINDEFSIATCEGRNTLGALEQDADAATGTPQCQFTAGDIRARENPILTSWHNMWLREHNRVARACAVANPTLDDETLFQISRSIVVAEWQNVVYGEWLPVLLGDDAMNKFGLNLDGGAGYKADVDPSIRNAFAAASFRFGHSMLQGSPISTDSAGENTTLRLRNIFFNPTAYVGDAGEGVEELVRGMLTLPSQTFDRFMTKDVTNFLLPASAESCFGGDLAARNIQRGRDHGIPGYLAFRELCGIPADPWWSEQFRPASIPKLTWKKLKYLYESPADIDLFTGGLVESPAAGALTGETFTCLNALQFQFLREGDRFFFTHTDQAGSFTPPQIAAIRARSLRDVICDNFPGITEARPKTFLLGSALESCNQKTNLNPASFVPPPPPAADEACVNKQERWCPYWKGLGFCTERFVNYMKQNCKKECGYCPAQLQKPGGGYGR
jgi:peroxidase